MSSDHAAIHAVTVLYCWLLDERSFDRLDEVFTSKAVAKLGSATQSGIAEIQSRCSSVLGGLDASHHMVTNHIIEVDGDTATSRCYMRAQHVLVGREGGDTYEVGGRYIDMLSRTDAGWRIIDRVLAVTWAVGNRAVIDR